MISVTLPVTLLLLLLLLLLPISRRCHNLQLKPEFMDNCSHPQYGHVRHTCPARPAAGSYSHTEVTFSGFMEQRRVQRCLLRRLRLGVKSDL
jgi:hypothetical protein